MWRFALLSLMLAVGCGTSTATKTDIAPKEPTKNKTPSDQKKKIEHDYKGWKEYAPTEGGFEVRFPTEPAIKAPSPATGNFHIAGTQRQAPDELEFMCQWIIKGQPYDSKQAEVLYLRSQQLGMLTASKGQLVDEEEITLDSANGREFTIAIPGKEVVRSRSYLAGKRMITIQVWGKDTQAVGSTDATKFLDSLKINN